MSFPANELALIDRTRPGASPDPESDGSVTSTLGEENSAKAPRSPEASSMWNETSSPGSAYPQTWIPAPKKSGPTSPSERVSKWASPAQAIISCVQNIPPHYHRWSLV